MNDYEESGHFVYHKSHMDWPAIKLRFPWWKAAELPPQPRHSPQHRESIHSLLSAYQFSGIFQHIKIIIIIIIIIIIMCFEFVLYTNTVTQECLCLIVISLVQYSIYNLRVTKRQDMACQEAEQWCLWPKGHTLHTSMHWIQHTYTNSSFH